jgi:hypothetical protein
VWQTHHASEILEINGAWAALTKGRGLLYLTSETMKARCPSKGKAGLLSL